MKHFNFRFVGLALILGLVSSNAFAQTGVLRLYKPILNPLAGIEPPVIVDEDPLDNFESRVSLQDTLSDDPEALLGMDHLNMDSTLFEFIPEVSYEEAGRRLALLQTTIPLNYNQYVKNFIDYFNVRDREYSRKVMRRMNLYFPLFEKYLKKYNLPDELKYLSVVESGLNTKAISRAGAAGLWQFMPYTGKLYKLHQDWYIDERFDPEKATEAACKYLKELYDLFNDWELALASYNAGPGNVRKAIRRSGYKKNFWDIYKYLPRETRSYVPQFVAVVYTFNYREEHNFFIDDYEYQMLADTIRVDGYIHLPTLANLLQVCPEDIEKLNPHLKRNAVPAHAKNYPVLIPSDRYELFSGARMAILDSASRVGRAEIEYIAKASADNIYGKEKITYHVKSGDVLGTIAARYRVRVSDIRKWNNLNSNLIRVGQRLTIYVNSSVASSVNSGPQPIPDSKIYIVQPGDTLWHISRKYQGLSIEKIKQLNNLKSNNIKPGQKLVLG